MKAFIVSLVISLSALSAYSQRVPSSCTASDSVVFLYKMDAAKIAIDREIQLDSSFIDSTIILQPLQDMFLRALLAVYNSGLQAADTMLGRVSLYNPINELNGAIMVHYYEGGALDQMYMVLDTSIVWERNFALGKFPTTNEQIDSLIQRFGIAIDTSQQGSIFYPTVKTNGYYNIPAIANEWNEVTDSETTAYTYARILQGSFIGELIGSDSSIKLTYSYQWGDCPSGCIFRHNWVFTIFTDCSVQFVNSYGDELSLPSSVSETLPNDSELLIFPNPTNQLLSIRTEPLATLEILTLDGKTIEHIFCTDTKQEISVAGLAQGTYLIRLTGSNGTVRTAKFGKE